MTKQEAINRIKRFCEKNGKTKLSGDFSIWNFVEGGNKVMDKIVSVGEDDGDLCAIGEDLVYPLEELSKRELESIYTLIKNNSK